MPSEAELPRGPVRDFVAVLFRLYREARRPPLREISGTIQRRDDLRGTASTETIRRMLRGATVPPHWDTIEAVLIGLCDMAGTDPNALRPGGERDEYDLPTRREELEEAWHRALDEPAGRYPVQANDPWANDPPF